MKKKIYIALLTLCMCLATPLSAGATFVDDGYSQFGGGGSDPAPAPAPTPQPSPAPTTPTRPSSGGSSTRKPVKKTSSYESVDITTLEKNQNLTLTVYYKDINDFYITADDKKVTFPKEVEEFTASAYYTDQKDGKLAKENTFPVLSDAGIHLIKDEKEQTYKKTDNAVGTAANGEKYDVKTYVLENAKAGAYKLFYKKDTLCSVAFDMQDIFVVTLLNEEKPALTIEESETEENADTDQSEDKDKDQEKEKDTQKKDEKETAKEEEDKNAEDNEEKTETEASNAPSVPDFAYLTVDATDKDAMFVTNADSGDDWYREIAKDAVTEDKENSIFHINMYADLNAPIMLLRGIDKLDSKAVITKTAPITCNIQVSESAITEDVLNFTINIETTTDATFSYDVYQNGESVKSDSLISNKEPMHVSVPLNLDPGSYEFKLHLYTENPAFENKVMEDTLLATYEKEEQVVSENTVSQNEPEITPEPEPEPEPFEMDNQTRLLITVASYGGNFIVYLIIFIIIRKIRKRKEDE